MGRKELPVKTQEWVKNLWADTYRIEYLAVGMSPLQYLRQRGLSDEYIEKYHFGYVAEGFYSPSISIPILDGLAEYKTVRFRRLGGEPKYDHPKGERAHLFNISSVRHPVVYLTEGEFDATILEQTGRAAVGLPGINNFRAEWRWLFSGNDVRLVLDSEAPGTEAWKNVRNATGRIIRQLEPVADNVSVIELPEGHDVSSLYVENPGALEEVLQQYD